MWITISEQQPPDLLNYGTNHSVTLHRISLQNGGTKRFYLSRFCNTKNENCGQTDRLGERIIEIYDA